MTACEGELILGRMVYETYVNEPSDYDGNASNRLGLPGYIIDYEKITRFTYDADSPWSYSIQQQYDRCGY